MGALTPWVQRLLIANVVIFFVTSVDQGLFQSLWFYPPIAIYKPWTLVTYMFLHGSIGHLFFNMLGLFFFGSRLETRLGSKSFLWLYFLAGVGGALFQTVFASAAPMVGASGAIFGLVGILIVHSGRRGGSGGQQLRSRLMQWAFLMFVISLMPGISLAAHAGGFLGGLALGLVVPAGEIRNRAAARAWEFLAVACILLVLFSFYKIAVHGSP